MNSLPLALQIGLLVALFAFGFVARRSGWLGPAHAGRMLQLVLNVGLPALFIANISRIELDAELVVLPGAAVAIMLVTLAVAWWTGRQLQLGALDQGAFLLCAMTINNAFLFPFVLAGWGQEGFARLALFDFGHAVMQASLVYAVAATYGGHGAGIVPIVRKLAAFPLLWALAAALAINFSGIVFPEPVYAMLGTVGRLVLLLVLVALGILFDAKLATSRVVMLGLSLRILLGLALGFAIAELFDAQGMTRAVLLLGSAAPVGFNAVVVASREGLNRDLAASAASVSSLLGFVYVPLGLWLLRP